jgi:hypothetical protein
VLGVLPLGRGTPAASPYPTFAGAQSTAQNSANSVGGGPWYVSFAISLVSRTSILEPTTNVSGLLSDANCTYDWPNGEPSNLAVPATPRSVGNGSAALWIVGLKNQTNGLLLDTVTLGSAEVLVTIRGADCSKATGELEAFPPGSVDTPAIIDAANAAGGGTFLSTYPNATQLWAGIGGVSLGLLGATTPEWEVEYTSCTLPAVAGESGAFFNATVAGLTADVINEHTETRACSLLTSSGFGGSSTPSSGALAARLFK